VFFLDQINEIVEEKEEEEKSTEEKEPRDWRFSDFNSSGLLDNYQFERREQMR